MRRSNPSYATRRPWKRKRLTRPWREPTAAEVKASLDLYVRGLARNVGMTFARANREFRMTDRQYRDLLRMGAVLEVPCEWPD